MTFDFSIPGDVKVSMDDYIEKIIEGSSERADLLNIIKRWVDAAYTSHHDCRGQSGGMMSLGAGAVISKSQKQ